MLPSHVGAGLPGTSPKVHVKALVRSATLASQYWDKQEFQHLETQVAGGRKHPALLMAGPPWK